MIGTGTTGIAMNATVTAGGITGTIAEMTATATDVVHARETEGPVSARLRRLLLQSRRLQRPLLRTRSSRRNVLSLRLGRKSGRLRRLSMKPKQRLWHWLESQRQVRPSSCCIHFRDFTPLDRMSSASCNTHQSHRTTQSVRTRWPWLEGLACQDGCLEGFETLRSRHG